jgi:hypothetical protein
LYTGHVTIMLLMVSNFWTTFLLEIRLGSTTIRHQKRKNNPVCGGFQSRPESPKPRKFEQTLSFGNVMVTVFWDRKGLSLCEFFRAGTTINAYRYCQTLRKICRTIQNKRRGMPRKECFCIWITLVRISTMSQSISSTN